jgi:hypothetical protein
MKNINSLEKKIAWEIGFAIKGILAYRALGIKEMEIWNRGRLAAAKTINGSKPINIVEAYKAFKAAR